jgi:outer membrane protein assembly factor BamB
MTADSMYWWHKDIEPAGNSNIRQIQIFNDRAFFQGSNSIHAVNMIDGTYQWKYEDTDKSFVCCHNIVFDEASNVVVDNYSNIDESGLIAWDADEGSVIWINTKANSYQAENKESFEGYVVQPSRSFNFFSANNGIIEHRYSDETNGQLKGIGDFIIDREKRQLYGHIFDGQLKLAAFSWDQMVEGQ